MERLREASNLVIGLILVMAVLVGTYLLLNHLFSSPAAAGPTIVTGGAVLVFAAGEYFTRERIAQQYRWDKVADTYLEFLNLVRKSGSGEPPEDLLGFMGKFQDDLLMWGSPKVITAWIEMNRATERGLKSDTEATELQRDLIRAIRKDLGQRDRKLDDRDLMHLLIHDIDEHFDAKLVPKKKLPDAAEAVFGSGK
ncbi:MAG TPA: hypothetical protein VMH33_09565 [Solirubrobacterales bacterium]|nr:hypothetical protein [Solirubrobacterales bacterium]